MLVINELMASNVGTVMSPATNFDSWIEIYNPSDESVNLAGMYLSDDAENLMRWHLPKDIGSVPAKGYKVIWLGSNDIKTTQAPFKLNCEGGTIYLSDSDGQLLLSQDYPEGMSRTSYARKTDGTGDWGWTADATPGASNATAAFADRRLDPPVVSQDSKVFTGTLTLDVTIPEGATLVYTTDGSVPVLPSGSQQQQEWTDYIVNGDCEGTDVTCLVGKDGESGGAYDTHIIDGKGYNGSRGIKVHSVANPSQDWDAQFFVYTPNHTWNAGDRYRFRMKVRADRAAHISAQSHTQPGSYIHWSMLDGGYNVTTQWQEITYEGTVTNEQAGQTGLQTIAFNLNELRGVENNYYFDDISWEAYNAATSGTVGTISQTGHFSVTATRNYCFRLFRDGWLPSVPVTRSYIRTNDKYTIPVVSIVGNPKYFTDNQWGIDTKGTNGRTGNGQNTKCNWNMDWERPVNFSFITPEGVMAYNQDVEISVSGGWTRSATPRSFKLKSGKEFDGQNRLDYAFFPQKPYLRNKTLLLRNGGNDIWENNGGRFLDPALQTIIQRAGINLDLQSYVPVIEYVNGECRGVINMREPNNKKFVEANFGYDDEKIDMFEMSADSNVVFMVGTSEVLERIYQLGAVSTDAQAYEELKQLLDIDEFINYMAVELFLGSTDWPHNNIKGFRNQADGRYRFVTFDLDFAFKSSNPFNDFANDQWHTFNLIYDTNEQRYEEIKLVTFFLNMLKNDDFRKRFIDTYCLVGGSVFDKTRATAIVNELADRVRPMMQLTGWSNPDTSANLIISKLATLNESMMTCMQQFKPMQLDGVRKQSVKLKTDTEGAHLYVNGHDVPYAAFDGRLFTPVRLEAKAPAGHTFAGWRQTSAGNQLIGTSSNWKYYDRGALYGSSWTSANYNDASWSSGESPLGYGMTGVKTTVSYGSNANQKNPTTYFRTAVSLTGTPTSNDIFTLDYQVDDGFIIYVNGSEAGRVNMPSGSVNYNTYSSTYAADTPLTGTLSLPATLFRSGRNVIAVEVHNNGASSSDLFWACRLNTSVDAYSDGFYSTEAEIDLPEDGAVSLTACFTPLSEEERHDQHITPVRINEVSAANNIHVNEYWKKNDWVELYNTTVEPIDVEGMYLTDNVSKPKKYQITKGSTEAGTIIPPHGHLIIWCDKLDPINQLHASFKLGNEDGDVMLTAADESWSDRLTYTTMKEDETVGRYPDGSNDVFVMTLPTIEQPNIRTSYQVAVAQAGENGIGEVYAQSQSDLSVRYVLGSLVIRSSQPGHVRVEFYNLAGQRIGHTRTPLVNGYGECSVGQLPSGCYVARISDANGHTTACKFVRE